MKQLLLTIALILGAANLIQCSLKVNPNGVVWCNGLMVGTTDGTRRPDGSLNIRFLSAGVANEGQSVAGGQHVGVANGGLIAGVAAGDGASAAARCHFACFHRCMSIKDRHGTYNQDGKGCNNTCKEACGGGPKK